MAQDALPASATGRPAKGACGAPAAIGGLS
jgi:hypothetical protein